MPAKEKSKERIKPVVEVVEEVEEKEESSTPKVKKTSGVSVEPDFSSRVSKSVGEDDNDSEDEVEVVEEVVEEEKADDDVEEVVEEVVVEEPEKTEEPEVEEVVEEVVVEEKKEDKPEIKEKHSKSTTVEHKMSLKTILAITVISALVAAFVSGGVYVYLNGVSDLKSNSDETVEEQVPSEVTEETGDETEEEPEPTEAPAVSDDLTVYSIQVLNGSGEIGSAGRASDVIEDGGFAVEETGNADNYDYTTTIVQYKEEINMADVDALVEALSTNYEVELSDDFLEEDSEYDFVVIVGTE